MSALLVTFAGGVAVGVAVATHRWWLLGAAAAGWVIAQILIATVRHLNEMAEGWRRR